MGVQAEGLLCPATEPCHQAFPTPTGHSLCNGSALSSAWDCSLGLSPTHTHRSQMPVLTDTLGGRVSSS